MVTIPEPEPEPVEEVDFQARAAELESQVAKLENDLRSKDGQRRRDTDRDAELAGFKDELSAMRRVFSTYMDNYNGNPEVQQQIDQINQEVAQRKRPSEKRPKRPARRPWRRQASTTWTRELLSQAGPSSSTGPPL